MFLLSLNIGTIGFFWWYLPAFVSRYYETITDLENNARVLLDRSPQLVVSWGPQSLKDPQLSHVAVVFAHLVHIGEAQERAYDRYFRALGLLAKNDIFGQFEHAIMAEFFESLREGLTAYGDWNGNSAEFEMAVGRVFTEMQAGSEFVAHLQEMVRLADEVRERKATKPVTLEEVVKMKVFCDWYFLTRARDEIHRRTKAKSNEENTAVNNS